MHSRAAGANLQRDGGRYHTKTPFFRFRAAAPDGGNQQVDIFDPDADVPSLARLGNAGRCPWTTYQSEMELKQLAHPSRRHLQPELSIRQGAQMARQKIAAMGNRKEG